MRRFGLIVLACAFAATPGLAKPKLCAIPVPELLQDMVQTEMDAKLGAQSSRYGSDFQKIPEKDGTLTVIVPGKSGDEFVVIVDPCNVKVVRSFVRPHQH